MCSPRLFQSTRAAWVAISPTPIRKSIRKMPPTPMPRAGWPKRLACSYSINLITPHRISRAGQKRANSLPRLWISRIPIVPHRNSTPIRMSTTGPAIERCGGGGGGGGIIGLATVHLACRWNWRDRWHGRRRRNRASRIWRDCTWSPPPRWRNMVRIRCTTLQQLDPPNHEQNYRPGAAKVHHMQVPQQEQEADRHHHRRAHDPPGAAARTLAARTKWTPQRAPVACEHPRADCNQNQRPEAIQTVFGPAHGVQHEQHAHQNKNDRTHWDFARLNFSSAPKRCRQAKRIRDRLSRLDRSCRTHRINNLVDPKEGYANSAEGAQSRGVIAVGGVGPGDEQNKNGQMRQSLRILAGVHSTHAERKKSGENSRHSRIGSTAASRRRRRWRDVSRCSRRGRCGGIAAGDESSRARRSASHLHPCSQAVLTIDHATHGTCTVRAQCLPASAAIGHC